MSVLSSGSAYILPAAELAGYFLPQISGVVRLPNGNFVITVSYASGTLGIATSTLLVDANGVAVAPQEFIYKDTVEPLSGVKILALADSSYGVVYQAPPAAGQTSMSAHGVPMVEWFSAGGTSLGAPTRLLGTSDPISFESNPGGPLVYGRGIAPTFDVVALGQKSLMVWTEGDVPGGPSSPGAAPGGIYAGTVSALGGAISTPVRVNQVAWPTPANVNTESVTTKDVDVIALSDGRALVTWHEIHATTTFIQQGPTSVPHTVSNHSIQARFLDAAGAPIGNQTTLVDFGTVAYDYSPLPVPEPTDLYLGRLIALADGKFAYAWLDMDPAETVSNLKVQVFSAAGAAIGSTDTLLSGVKAYTTPYFEMVALPNGGFAVEFARRKLTLTADPFLESAPQIQVYGADGQRQGGLLEMPGANQDDQPSLADHEERFGMASLASASDGSVMVAGWTNLPTYKLTAQRFDFLSGAVNPTDGDDVAILTAADNVYGGRGGRDLIYGQGGADVIYGDKGNDYLDGGAGVDRLDGGSGDDTVVFDPSDDLANVLGGDGIDLLLSKDGYAPTTFSLSLHGFESARVEDVDTSGQAWASYYRLYDDNWNITQQYTIYDNGASIRVGYASGIDAGKQDWQQENRADGTLQYYTDWDQAGSQTWSQTVEYYAANGTTRTQKLTTYDNGTSIRVGYDAAGNPDWQQEMRANGTLDIYTDWDQALNQTFVQTVEYYAADGSTRTQKNTIYDNGTSIRVGYDAHGHADWQEERRANGTLEFYTDWDQDDATTINYFVRYYQADGITVNATHVYYDNGTDLWL